MLFLYKIEQDQQIQLSMTIMLKPGGYHLRVQDSLIILHNYGPQESLVFDIKKDIKPEICFLMVKHRGLNSSLSNIHQVQYLSEIDPHFLAIDKYFYFDIIGCKLMTLKIYPLILVEEYPDSLESILFLLRRQKCLKDALALLKICLEKKFNINRLIEFFHITNYTYKETAMLRKINRKDSRESVQQPELAKIGSKKIDKPSENELKSKSGVTILLQSDMYISVFKPFYKEIRDFSYLSYVLISYIHSLIAQDLHVHISHQYLLVKTLIKIENYQLVQYLLQYQMLGNNLDIALLLTSLNDNHEELYPELFNPGIDMLHRLKQFSTIVKILVEKGDIFEALIVITTYEDRYDLEHLMRYSLDSGYEQIIKETFEEYGIKILPL